MFTLPLYQSFNTSIHYMCGYRLTNSLSVKKALNLPFGKWSEGSQRGEIIGDQKVLLKMPAFCSRL